MDDDVVAQTSVSWCGWVKVILLDYLVVDAIVFRLFVIGCLRHWEDFLALVVDFTLRSDASQTNAVFLMLALFTAGTLFSCNSLKREP